MEMAKSMERGITEATMNPARIFPSNKTKMKTTINAPSIRFLETVPIARPTRSERSQDTALFLLLQVMISEIDFIRDSTFSVTSLALAPFNIITTPPTASDVSTTNAP